MDIAERIKAAIEELNKPMELKPFIYYMKGCGCVGIQWPPGIHYYCTKCGTQGGPHA